MARLVDILNYPQYEQGGRFNLMAIPQLFSAIFDPKVREEIETNRALRTQALQNALGGQREETGRQEALRAYRQQNPSSYTVPQQSEVEALRQMVQRGGQQDYELGRRKAADIFLDKSFGGVPFEALPTQQTIERGATELGEYKATQPDRLTAAALSTATGQEQLSQLRSQGQRQSEYDQQLRGMTITMPDGTKVPYHQAKMLMELQSGQRALAQPQGGREVGDLLQTMLLSPAALTDPSSIRPLLQQYLQRYGIQMPAEQQSPAQGAVNRVLEAEKRITKTGEGVQPTRKPQLQGPIPGRAGSPQAQVNTDLMKLILEQMGKQGGQIKMEDVREMLKQLQLQQQGQE